MGIGDSLVGDVETLMATRTLRAKSLFRMRGERSQCWQAEGEIQRMYPGMRCLLLPSATIGLSLVLETLDIPEGREVLISPFGWLANWSCIRRAGLVPRFVPLDENLQLDPDVVAGYIGDNTGAVIVTHLMGRGQQAVGEIARICEARGVPLLEDIAQSFGVSVGGQRAGTFGRAAWCSLNHHKLLSTGDGGFVLAGEEDMFGRIGALHDQGCAMRNGARSRPNSVEPGLSLRVNELTAAVLRAQLARYHLMRARILRMHEALAAEMENRLGLELIAPNPGDLPFTVLFRKPRSASYPSMTQSGWHVAPNVPWLSEEYMDASQDDPALTATIHNLSSVSAVGSGFVDPYYAIQIGLEITDPLDRVAEIIEALEEKL